MATTRPFAYNPTEATIGGTTNIGKLCVGVSAQDYSINPGGIKWWMGPNEDPKYIIAKDYPPSNRPTPVGNIGTVFFKKCAKNDQAFINLVNHISGTSQTTVQDALTWLSANGYWTSYVPGIITTGLQLHLDAGNLSSYPGTGTKWQDLSGNDNGLDMQNSGSISWTDGGIGYFSTGSTGWFGKLNGSNMPTGNSLYTMSVWAKLPTTWNANGLIAIGTFGVDNQSNAFRAGSTNQLLNYWWGNDLSVTSSVSPTDSWFNAVTRFDGTTRKIFVNGVSVGSDTPIGHNVISSNIYVGKTYNNEYLNGIISQALIYNVSLSDAEVLANFNNTKSKFGL